MNDKQVTKRSDLTSGVFSSLKTDKTNTYIFTIRITDGVIYRQPVYVTNYSVSSLKTINVNDNERFLSSEVPIRALSCRVSRLPRNKGPRRRGV